MNEPSVCGYCQGVLGDGEERIDCPSCHTSFHAECWQENGGCATYGCTQAPAVMPRRELEIPASWWGREQKPCPVCGQEILATAVRCRHCGATFVSARPEDAAEFQRRAQRQEQMPQLKRKVVWQFALSIFPFTAPVGAVYGLVWYWSNRREVRSLPSFFPALGILGLIVGLFQTGAFVVFTTWYLVSRL